MMNESAMSEEYPPALLPAAELAAAFAALPAIGGFLGALNVYSVVHTNCRIFLTGTALAYLVVVITNIAEVTRLLHLGVYFTARTHFPDGGSVFLIVHDAASLLSSVLVLAAIIDLLLVSTLLKKYRQSVASITACSVAACVATMLSFWLACVAHGVEKILSAAVIGNSLDASACALAIACVKFSRYRYKSTFAKCSLNVRFQVSSVIDITKTLLPVVISSFLLNFLSLASAWLSNYESPEYSCGFLSGLFYIGHSLSALFCSLFFVAGHRGVRRRLLALRARVLPIGRAAVTDSPTPSRVPSPAAAPHSAPVSPLVQPLDLAEASARSDAYFKMFDRSLTPTTEPSSTTTPTPQPAGNQLRILSSRAQIYRDTRPPPHSKTHHIPPFHA